MNFFENNSPVIKNISNTDVETIFENGILVNVTPETIFALIKNIKDPEHPYTLEQLSVISQDDVSVFDSNDDAILVKEGLPIPTIRILLVPTIPHCSMIGIIGLCVIYKLKQAVPYHWIQIIIKEGTHQQDKLYTKQLSDMDRVSTAFENDSLLEIIDDCIQFVE